VALRRSLFRWVVWPGLCCAAYLAVVMGLVIPFANAEAGVFVSPLFAFVPVAIVMALCVLAGIWWYRRAAFAWTHSMLVMRRGYFGQVTTIIPRRKIQWVASKQNPLQRWRKVATIGATTAAGVTGTTTALRDVSVAQADDFIAWTRPHGNMAAPQA
jgi:uncharacterized membrane protein YdbT with pleckstrin-like domain